MELWFVSSLVIQSTSFETGSLLSLGNQTQVLMFLWQALPLLYANQSSSTPLTPHPTLLASSHTVAQAQIELEVLAFLHPKW